METDEESDNIAGFWCFMCLERGTSFFVPGTYNCLTKHLRTVHYIKTNGGSRHSMICAQNGCKSHFQYFSTYRQHLHVCAKVTRHQLQPAAIPSTSVIGYDHQATASDNLLYSNPQHQYTGTDELSQKSQSAAATLTRNIKFDCTNRFGTLFLKLRAYYNVSHEPK